MQRYSGSCIGGKSDIELGPSKDSHIQRFRKAADVASPGAPAFPDRHFEVGKCFEVSAHLHVAPTGNGFAGEERRSTETFEEHPKKLFFREK